MEKDIPVAAMDVEAIPVDINGKEKNMIKAVLFDLDGTLLPMDQDAFIKTYFHALAKKMASYGYEPETLMKAVGAGTMAMVKNDGSITNEERFWRTFGQFFDKDVRKDESIFEDFYRNELNKAANRALCHGFFYEHPTKNEQLFNLRDEHPTQEFVLRVVDYNPETKLAKIEQRNYFKLGDKVEIFSPKHDNIIISVDELYNEDMESIDVANHPMELLYLKVDYPVVVNDMGRKVTHE
jgi:hypothetical protein